MVHKCHFKDTYVNISCNSIACSILAIISVSFSVQTWLPEFLLWRIIFRDWLVYLVRKQKSCDDGYCHHHHMSWLLTRFRLFVNSHDDYRESDRLFMIKQNLWGMIQFSFYLWTFLVIKDVSRHLLLISCEPDKLLNKTHLIRNCQTSHVPRLLVSRSLMYSQESTSHPPLITMINAFIEEFSN